MMSSRDRRPRTVGAAHARPAGRVPEGCSPWRTRRAQGPYGCEESSKKCSLHGDIEKLHLQ